MKFEVKVLEVHSFIIEVDADNENDARIKASDLLSSVDLDETTLKYEHTLDPDEWKVWEA